MEILLKVLSHFAPAVRDLKYKKAVMITNKW